MLHTKVWRRGIVVKYFTRISVRISCKIAEDHSAAQADQVDANDVFMTYTSHSIIPQLSIAQLDSW